MLVRKNYKKLIAVIFIFNPFKIDFLRYCRKNLLFLLIIINNKKYLLQQKLHYLKFV